MTEEIENPNDMSTFSFFDVLEGTSYPEDSVTVALDEKAGYEAKKIMREVAELEDPTEEQLADIRKRLDDVRARIEKSKITFDLRGVSAELVAGTRDVVDEMFVDKKKTIMGADNRPRKYLPDEHAMDYARMMNAVVMSMFVTRWRHHGTDTVRTGMNQDEMAAFFDKAPAAAKERLAQAINDLKVEAQAYESDLDEGFFPKS